jgi:hypothetical protein
MEWIQLGAAAVIGVTAFVWAMPAFAAAIKLSGM